MYSYLRHVQQNTTYYDVLFNLSEYLKSINIRGYTVACMVYLFFYVQYIYEYPICVYETIDLRTQIHSESKQNISLCRNVSICNISLYDER